MKRQILISSLILLSIQTLAAAALRLVPQQYPNIKSAITAAVNGDVVVVAPGTYTGENNINLDFGGKAITVQSTINPANPNPATIAATIIDCGGQPAAPAVGDSGAANRAFRFHSGEGNNSKVLGFTIRNGYARGPKGADGVPDYNGDPLSDFIPIPPCDDPNDCPPYADDGEGGDGPGHGGAILCENASSPTIQYCVITNCTVTGGQGGRGGDGQNGTWLHWTLGDEDPCNPGQINPDAEPTENPDGQWGGRGGNGSGNGYGGAVACRVGSSPIISDCNISDNFARGGCGGDGGNGGHADGDYPTYNEGAESFGGNAGASVGDGIGGGIYAENGSSPIITNCTFSNDIATTGARAEGGSRGQGTEISQADGGPATDGADGIVYTLTHRIAGGAAYYRQHSDANFTNCTFTGNKAYEAYIQAPAFGIEDISAYTVGGALYSDANDANIILYDCEFIGSRGGAVYCDSNGHLNFDDCLFTDNSETTNGGALYIDTGCTVNLQSCIFGGNSAYDDGGALKCRSNATFTNCSFGTNRADSDDDSYGYGGAIDAYEPGTTLIVDFNACSFVGNQAIYGGGFSSKDSDVNFTDCYFIDNTAREGGGLNLSNGDLFVTGGIIKGNNATYSGGGGLMCSVTKTEIRNCTISDNSADGVYGSGGAINFYGGFVTHLAKNCLITGNTATVNGGGISCELFALPEIQNCTFSDNSAGGYGGAIFSDFISNPNITDCIFNGCNNHAIHEEDAGGDAIARYCLFYNNPNGDYYDSVAGLVPVGSIPGGVANLYANPLFVAGPFGNYYLSQTAAGQGSNSPAINNGSDTALNLGLNTFTTRTDNVGDDGQVDRGYHYPDSTGVGTFQLTASVTGGNGTISPTSGTYYAGTVATLTATPSPGWRVKSWSGTGNDSSTATTNTVIMNSDKTVGVEFEQPKTLIVAVGGGGGLYANINAALHDAEDGDTIVVYPGTYIGVRTRIIKNVEIKSQHPDDPNWVAQTVIDSTGHAGPAFEFDSGVGPGCILNGFTIRNSRWYTDTGDDGANPGENGEDGPGAEGSAIFIEPGAGPIIKNCIIRDNFILGGFGGTGANADDTHNAGRGGWGGFARGGAVYCGTNSYPQFINCRILDNMAVGGIGGNGGDWSETGGSANYGGNWSMAEWWNRLTNSTNREWVEGDLWEVWYTTYIAGDAYIVGPPYIGDYRWYSGYGGGVFIDRGSNVTFTDCTISGNLAQGGLSGLGGEEPGSGIYRAQPWPLQYEIPSFGGGVYCAADSSVTFTGCTIADNVASDPLFNHRTFAAGIGVEGDLGTWIQAEYDPCNHFSIDPYLGHGGGVCAEDTATVVFTDCTFSGNEADAGGGVHISNTELIISDCNFTLNSAFQGGGLFGQNGPATILRSSFTDNTTFSDASDPNVLGQGGGLHFWSVDTDIIDCIISGNQADSSGGGAFFGGESTPFLTNCLLTNNTAGRNGGGASTNNFSSLTASNCTVAGNVATGVGSEIGYGGGMYCSYSSYTKIINSIIWGNYGQIGPQLAIRTSFAPSAMDVSYSDVQSGQSYVFKDAGCILNWGAGNILANPLFVTGPLGDYYLSQIAAGQPLDSNCIDAGSDSAVNLGMNRYTTRTDEQPDRKTVNMGYHYPITPEELCRFCELFHDGIINFKDLAIFALNWLSEDCNPANERCQHADVTLDGYVDFEDVQLFAECWLVEDTYPPVPNPSEWEIEPYSSSSPEHPDSISMTARTASDAWDFWVGNVQYYFECVYGDCNDSGWQDEPNYTDPNLVVGVEYGYRVRARDAGEQIPDDGTGECGNKTEWSPIRYAIVGEEPPPPEDHNPPTPNPMTWQTAPYATSPTTILMVATTATDDTASVEYYFEDFDDPAVNSGWQGSPAWQDTTCEPETMYRYRVMARDTSAWHNQTGWSTVLGATTPAVTEPPPPPDTTAPAPVLWEVAPYESGGGLTAYANMTAAEATDAGGNGVLYYFECTSIPAINSGWTTERVWEGVYIGRENQFLYFHFRVSDNLGNTSGWSTSLPCY